MQVVELMNENVITISPEDSAALAARLLFRHNIGAIPVCTEDRRLRGIVTDRDIVLRCVAAENAPEKTKVKEIMTRSVITVSPEDDVRRAAHQMASGQVRRLPVVWEGELVGMLSIGDMAKSSSYNMEASKALSEISSNIRRL